MIKMRLVIAGVLAGAAMQVPLFTPVIVHAVDGETKAQEQQAEAAKKAAELQAEAAKKAEERLKQAAEKRAEAEKKIQEARQKACENRRESFKKRMEGVAERSKKRLEIFDKITERVEAFVKNKNLDVPNYDQLLADVQAKREALHDAHTVAKERADDFDCDKEAGKTNVLSFKEALSGEIDAFKAYKEALKNLIKAVKAAAASAGDGA